MKLFSIFVTSFVLISTSVFGQVLPEGVDGDYILTSVCNGVKIQRYDGYPADGSRGRTTYNVYHIEDSAVAYIRLEYLKLGQRSRQEYVTGISLAQNGWYIKVYTPDTITSIDALREIGELIDVDLIRC